MNENLLIRQVANVHSSCPINFVPGKQPPKSKGRGYWFRWLGKWKTAPGSYQSSTLHVVVGEEWQPRIPKGMKLINNKKEIVLVRESDGMDLHIVSCDILRKDFCTWVRKTMADNYKKRQETKRVERQQKRFLDIFNKEIHSTYVLMEDSRRAGNCVAGTVSFAKSHGIDKIHDWFSSLPAKICLRSGNERAIAAAKQAFMRETTISI